MGCSASKSIAAVAEAKGDQERRGLDPLAAAASATTKNEKNNDNNQVAPSPAPTSSASSVTTSSSSSCSREKSLVTETSTNCDSPDVVPSELFAVSSSPPPSSPLQVDSISSRLPSNTNEDSTNDDDTKENEGSSSSSQDSEASISVPEQQIAIGRTHLASPEQIVSSVRKAKEPWELGEFYARFNAMESKWKGLQEEMVLYAPSHCRRTNTPAADAKRQRLDPC